jgi:hypothetical protein
MDRLAARSTDVALLYLVPAPDLAPVSRATRNRRRDLLLQIDAAFARRGSRDCPYQMSVLAGDRRAGRRSVFVPAGSLSVRTLPKVEVGHFDLAARVDDVLATRERDIASLWRRGTAVVRTDVVLLSTNAPLADIDAVERFQELCAEVRLSWILLDADVELLSDEFESAGAEIFEDHPDVVNALMTAAFAADRPEDANSDPSEDLAADRPEDADFDPPEGFAAGRPEYLAATRPQDEADLAVPGD